MPAISTVAGAQSSTTTRPQLGRRSQCVVLLLATWTVLGLFLDVWSHGQFQNESFFSPWHALFFPGFAAAAAYIVWPAVRSMRAGRPAYAGVPVSYDLGIAGVLIFLCGVSGDAVWHTVFGVERGIEAVMSPPHVLLVVGLVLISSIPFRAAWVAQGEDGDAPSFRAFLPALLSLALSMLMIAVGAFYFWGFHSARLMSVRTLERFIAEIAPATAGLPLVHEAAQDLAFSSILITNLILLAPVFVLLRRWRPPFGSATLLFTVPAILMAAVAGMFYPPLLIAPVLGGLLADGLIQRWRPSSLRTAEIRAIAIVVPLVMWSMYFLATQFLWGVAWPMTMWAGAILWASASGLGLSLVAFPGRTP